MDRRCRAELAQAFPGDQGKIDYMAIIGDNQVRTANICAYTCHAINGVSKLHSEIKMCIRDRSYPRPHRW